MLQAKDYVVLLRTNPAEVTAFHTLSPDAKSVTFPIFRAKPWQNANRFAFTLDSVRDAVDGHPYGLTLDADSFGNSNKRPAQSEFEALFDERSGFSVYYRLIGTLDGAVPVLMPTESAENLALQFENAERLDRGLIVHIQRSSRIPLLRMIAEQSALPPDTVFLIDAGWSRDYPMLEAWTSPTIGSAAAEHPDSELVVMASGFPDSFEHIVGEGEEMILERRLFAAMRQRYNQADLTYGDWGSTRPSQGGGGATIPSRIDLPGARSWTIFRADPKADSGFAALSNAVVRHPAYRNAPDCHGKEMIARTGDGPEGITGSQRSTLARISLHITTQSGASGGPSSDEQPYVD